MNDGLEGAVWLCTVQEREREKCFLTGFYPPRPWALVQWEEPRHISFLLFQFSPLLSSSKYNNWSVWLDQSSFSRLTNSGFSMFFTIMFSEQLHMYLQQIESVIWSTPSALEDEAILETSGCDHETTFTMTMEPTTMAMTIHNWLHYCTWSIEQSGPLDARVLFQSKHLLQNLLLQRRIWIRQTKHQYVWLIWDQNLYRYTLYRLIYKTPINGIMVTFNDAGLALIIFSWYFLSL